MDKKVSLIIKLLVTQSMLCKSQAYDKTMKNSNANIIKNFQKTSFWCQLAYNTQANGYMLTEKKVFSALPGERGQAPYSPDPLSPGAAAASPFSPSDSSLPSSARSPLAALADAAGAEWARRPLLGITSLISDGT